MRHPTGRGCIPFLQRRSPPLSLLKPPSLCVTHSMYLMPRFMRPAPAAHPLRLRLGSDVMCEYPLQDMLDFHKARKAEATILVTKVSIVAAEARRTGSQRVNTPSAALWQSNGLATVCTGGRAKLHRSRRNSSSCPQCCLCGMWLCLKLQDSFCPHSLGCSRA